MVDNETSALVSAQLRASVEAALDVAERLLDATDRERFRLATLRAAQVGLILVIFIFGTLAFILVGPLLTSRLIIAFVFIVTAVGLVTSMSPLIRMSRHNIARDERVLVHIVSTVRTLMLFTSEDPSDTSSHELMRARLARFPVGRRGGDDA